MSPSNPTFSMLFGHRYSTVLLVSNLSKLKPSGCYLLNRSSQGLYVFSLHAAMTAADQLVLSTFLTVSPPQDPGHGLYQALQPSGTTHNHRHFATTSARSLTTSLPCRCRAHTPPSTPGPYDAPHIARGYTRVCCACSPWVCDKD